MQILIAILVVGLIRASRVYTHDMGEINRYCIPVMPGVNIQEGFQPELEGRTDVFAWPGRNGLVQIPCSDDGEDRCDSCILDCGDTERVFCADEMVVATGQFDSSQTNVPRAKVQSAGGLVASVAVDSIISQF